MSAASADRLFLIPFFSSEAARASVLPQIVPEPNSGLEAQSGERQLLYCVLLALPCQLANTAGKREFHANCGDSRTFRQDAQRFSIFILFPP